MLTLDNHMLAVGSCLAGAGILATGLLALLFRHPRAPRWTRPEIVPMLLCVPVTAAIGFGLGYAAYGVSLLRGGAGAGDPRELLVLAGVLIVLALAWRGLRIRQRLKDYARAGGGVVTSGDPAATPTLATDGQPPPRPGPRSLRRAA